MTVKQGIKVARDESNQAANAPTVTSVFMPVVFCRVALMAPVKKRLSTLKTTGVVKKKGMTKSPQPPLPSLPPFSIGTHRQVCPNFPNNPPAITK